MKNLIPSIPILIAVLSSARGAEEVRFAQVGETVTLTPTKPNGARYLYWSCCNQNEVANLNPIASSWTIKSRMSVSTSNSALTIKQLRDEDFVTYTFSKLVGKDTKVSVYTHLHYTPSLVMDVNPSSPLLIGESLSVTCNAKTPQNLHRKPEIYLLDPQGGRVKTGPGTNSFKATRQHNGNWTCVVKYNQKQYSATVPVTVLDLSPASSSYQYASYSSPLTIPCSIFPQITMDQIKARGFQEVHWQFYSKPSPSVGAGDPKTLFSLSLNKLEWKPNRLPSLNPVPAQKGNFSLTKRPGKKVDTGDYVCTAKFDKDVTLTRTIHVEVLEIIAYPGKNLTSGQQLHLICGIGLNMSSDLQLKWVPPEQSLQSDLVHANFTITEVSTRDSGKWRCELWQGSTKLTSEEITLKIEPKLSAWMLVIICSAAAIVVLLLVLVFILCRRRQRKMRHPRHRLCQCKSPKPKGFYKT
uniref:Ig-like domain-containing protein n=1 Tax=Anabas testudineus TaxID=64144 RepID=A0A7N6AX00_ANATE